MIKDTVIDELIGNLSKLNINDVASKAITSQTLNDAVDLNLEQLGDGELNDGQEMGNYARNTVARNKERSTQVSTSERIKFYNTGAFYRSVKAKITKKGELRFSSSSRKPVRLREYLEDKGYDGDLLGLKDENLIRWTDYIKEDVINEILIRIKK